MLILAITSSTARVGCAVGADGDVNAVVQTTRDRHHAELLAPQIAAACTQAGVALQDVDAVAVDIGPGLYTGLRVGVTTAVTIAHALQLPMIATRSLDLVAFGVRCAIQPVCAVLDARRGEVFWALYQPDQDGNVLCLSEPAVGPPEQVASEIVLLSREPAPVVDSGESESSSRDGVLMAGDGVALHDSVFASLSSTVMAGPEFAHPSAEMLLHRSFPFAHRREFTSPQRIRPLYLRRPDARPGVSSKSRAVL